MSAILSFKPLILGIDGCPRVFAIQSSQPKYNDDRSPEYRVVYVSDIFGGHQIDYFEVTVRTISINASESEKAEEVVLDRVEQVCLKMSPQQAKIVHDWLSLQIDQYERKFGRIAFYDPHGKRIVTKEEVVDDTDHTKETVKDRHTGPMFV
jgi:hypothetical protein